MSAQNRGQSASMLEMEAVISCDKFMLVIWWIVDNWSEVDY